MYKLRLINDDESQVIDLLHGPLRVYNWGWSPKFTSLRQRGVNLPFGYQTTSVGYGAVTETFSLQAVGCPEDIRLAVKCLEVFLEGAAAHMDDPLVENAHWLEWSAGGEDPKRSLVTGGAISPLSGVGHWPMLSDERLNLTLALTRHPLWENATAETDTESAVSTVGGTWTFAATPGRVPARISHMMLRDNSGGIYAGADADLTTFWMGWRPEYEGLTGFDPVWECESTAIAGGHSTILDVADTADTAYDATYHNGYGVTTTFTDTVMEERISIAVHDVVADDTAKYQDFVGRYLVLARCWIDDDTKSAILQMRHGYDETTARIACDPIVVTHETARYVELGTIQIPPPGLWPPRTPTSLGDQISSFTIWLHSQNVDATSMTIDCLVLIPADYFVKLSDATVFYDAAPSAEDITVLSTLPDDRVFAFGGQYAGVARTSVCAAPNQWYLPVGTSMLVVAGEQAAVQDINDDLDITMDWHPRWESYRE